MKANGFYDGIEHELEEIEQQGLFKRERVINSAQGRAISVQGKEVLNFCANNYLGLADNERLIAKAKEALDRRGLGLASVRFICGTQDIHKSLEQRLAAFFAMDDCILYPSCFDANGGLFETLLGEEDAVLSDALNHASIIDGIRLCKAKRYRFQHSDMADLERCLKEAEKEGARRILVSTDGVFSMDGEIAKLPEICKLAASYGAVVHIDDCHASGALGRGGRGTPEHFGLTSGVDIITSTLGKALGGSAGGFTLAKTSVVSLLRQRSRPYLFSNTLAPAIVAGAHACLDFVDSHPELLDRLRENTAYFRQGMSALKFSLKGETHPIVPVMLGDARLATAVADDLLEEGIYVIGFSFPVVPRGEARIRVQISAGHTRADLDRALAAFEKVGRAHRVI